MGGNHKEGDLLFILQNPTLVSNVPSNEIVTMDGERYFEIKFTYTVTDAAGHSSSGPIDVYIEDGSPVASI